MAANCRDGILSRIFPFKRLLFSALFRPIWPKFSSSEQSFKLRALFLFLLFLLLRFKLPIVIMHRV